MKFGLCVVKIWCVGEDLFCNGWHDDDENVRNEMNGIEFVGNGLVN